MTTVLFFFTLLLGIGLGGSLLWGYLLSLKQRKSPKWLNLCKIIFFCGFFGGWLLWNLFRNIP